MYLFSSLASYCESYLIEDTMLIIYFTWNILCDGKVIGINNYDDGGDEGGGDSDDGGDDDDDDDYEAF